MSKKLILTLIALSFALLISACGKSTPNPTPSPTPIPTRASNGAPNGTAGNGVNSTSNANSSGVSVLTGTWKLTSAKCAGQDDTTLEGEAPTMIITSTTGSSTSNVTFAISQSGCSVSETATISYVPNYSYTGTTATYSANMQGNAASITMNPANCDSTGVLSTNLSIYTASRSFNYTITGSTMSVVETSTPSGILTCDNYGMADPYTMTFSR